MSHTGAARSTSARACHGTIKKKNMVVWAFVPFETEPETSHQVARDIPPPEEIDVFRNVHRCRAEPLGRHLIVLPELVLNSSSGGQVHAYKDGRHRKYIRSMKIITREMSGWWGTVRRKIKSTITPDRTTWCTDTEINVTSARAAQTPRWKIREAHNPTCNFRGDESFAAFTQKAQD